MAKKQSIDELRHEYVTTNISLRELAEKYGVGLYSFDKLCKKEGWVEQRQNTHKRTTKKAVTKTIDQQAAHLAKITATTDMLGDKLRMLIETLNPLELDSLRDYLPLTRAWKDYLSSNTLVRGLMTPLEVAQLELSRDRLTMDQKKNDSDKNKVSAIRIIMTDEVDELIS